MATHAEPHPFTAGAADTTGPSRATLMGRTDEGGRRGKTHEPQPAVLSHLFSPRWGVFAVSIECIKPTAAASTPGEPL